MEEKRGMRGEVGEAALSSSMLAQAATKKHVPFVPPQIAAKHPLEPSEPLWLLLPRDSKLGLEEAGQIWFWSSQNLWDSLPSPLFSSLLLCRALAKEGPDLKNKGETPPRAYSAKSGMNKS